MAFLEKEKRRKKMLKIKDFSYKIWSITWAEEIFRVEID